MRVVIIINAQKLINSYWPTKRIYLLSLKKSLNSQQDITASSSAV